MTWKSKGERLTSVRIRPDIVARMKRYLQRGMSQTEIINEALRQYLAEREFQELRNKLLPYAQAKGIYTDEDVERFFR